MSWIFLKAPFEERIPKVDLCWLMRDIFSVDLSMRLGKFPNEPKEFPNGIISV